MSSLKYWLWLTSRRGMDPASALAALDHFGSPERAYYAREEEWLAVPVGPAARRGLGDKSLEAAEKILEDSQRLNLRIMTFQDADYPTRLKQIAVPPPVLYIRGGSISFDEEAAIAVVGTRKPSSYGISCAKRFGMELAQGGALVVSGVAEGLDSWAVRGALAGGGRVVSVVAGGVDVPQSSPWIYEDVAAAGAVISEYPPGTPNLPNHFRARNRILSGLSLGVLAIECRTRSGTMSTVRHALEQDRDVFAVPGALDAPMGEGTNQLIRQGAKLVTRGEDILEEYRGFYPLKLRGGVPLAPEAARERLAAIPEQLPTTELERSVREPDPVPEPVRREVVPLSRQKSRFTDDELAVLAALEGDLLTADQVVERTQLPARRVLSALTTLQIVGGVEEKGGKRFAALVELEQLQS